MGMFWKQRKPHGVKVALVFLWLLLLAWAGPQARADLLPHSSINKMCMEADWIVAGTHEGHGKIRILESFYPDKVFLKKGNTITLPKIAFHDRKRFDMKKGLGEEIETQTLVLFLKMEELGVMNPLQRSAGGSQGVVWYDDKECFRYQQIENPGGYSLVSSHQHQDSMPKDKAALWKELKVGAESRALWEDIKAIEHPERRALAMASLLVEETRPEGNFEGADVAGELFGIGRDAIPAIAEVLEKLGPDEDAKAIIGAVHTMAVDDPFFDDDRLEPVVMPLVHWLDTVDKSHPGKAITILYMARDPRAAKSVRRFLKHQDRDVRAVSAGYLGTVLDRESFDQIAQLLIHSKIQGAIGYNLSLATALFKLDPDRARPLIKAAEAREGNHGLGMYIDGYDDRVPPGF